MSNVDKFPKDSLVVNSEWDSSRVVRVTTDTGGKYVYMYDDALKTEVVSERRFVRFALPSDAINGSVLEDRFEPLDSESDVV